MPLIKRNECEKGGRQEPIGQFKYPIINSNSYCIDMDSVIPLFSSSPGWLTERWRFLFFQNKTVEKRKTETDTEIKWQTRRQKWSNIQRVIRKKKNVPKGADMRRNDNDNRKNTERDEKIWRKRLCRLLSERGQKLSKFDIKYGFTFESKLDQKQLWSVYSLRTQQFWFTLIIPMNLLSHITCFRVRMRRFSVLHAFTWIRV